MPGAMTTGTPIEAFSDVLARSRRAGASSSESRPERYRSPIRPLAIDIASARRAGDIIERSRAGTWHIRTGHSYPPMRRPAPDPAGVNRRAWPRHLKTSNTSRRRALEDVGVEPQLLCGVGGDMSRVVLHRVPQDDEPLRAERTKGQNRRKLAPNAARGEPGHPAVVPLVPELCSDCQLEELFKPQGSLREPEAFGALIAQLRRDKRRLGDTCDAERTDVVKYRPWDDDREREAVELSQRWVKTMKPDGRAVVGRVIRMHGATLEDAQSLFARRGRKTAAQKPLRNTLVQAFDAAQSRHGVLQSEVAEAVGAARKTVGRYKPEDLMRWLGAAKPHCRCEGLIRRGCRKFPGEPEPTTYGPTPRTTCLKCGKRRLK